MQEAKLHKPHRSADQWRALLRRFEHGDLTAEAFCREESISRTSLNRWRRKLLAEDISQDFVELQPAAAHDSEKWTLELDLPGGARLRIRS